MHARAEAGSRADALTYARESRAPAPSPPRARHWWRRPDSTGHRAGLRLPLYQPSTRRGVGSLSFPRHGDVVVQVHPLGRRLEPGVDRLRVARRPAVLGP